MKHIVPFLLFVCLMAISGIASYAVPVQNGVSWNLAQYRSAHISNVHYSLAFNIPEDVSKPVSFDETIVFLWSGNEDLQIDFQGTENQLKETLIVNGHNIKTNWKDEHIIIAAHDLVQGENHISIGGLCGDKALNRHEEYMYTLFVPDHARSVFPCFDQPDLKAHFELTLSVPDGWTAISNAPLKNEQNRLDVTKIDADNSVNQFFFSETSRPIPTYLFSFTAGKFNVQTATRDGRSFTALYRETDPQKVAQLSIVFDQVALSLRWMEDYTGIAYPFEKYDFVILPGYQFGGMEHPGCIQFTDWEIFLGPNPTPDEERTRLNLLAHETSHMWFGDLVTMRWFDDVWTKEVYANFMADKISREQFPDIDHDLAFIKAHYPTAMSTDRTQGTHPIQQPLDNLNKAGLLYGNIIYHKAPIMMRKLEQEKGADALQQGLRSYLSRYAYGNATWDDLIAELDKFAPEHSAQSFSDVWVKQKGMPVVNSSNLMHDVVRLVQSDPYGRGLMWKQGFDIGYVDEDGQFCEYPIYMNDYEYLLSSSYSKGLYLNSNAEGYGQFALNSEGMAIMSEAWKTMRDNDKARYAAVLNLYENYHLGNITAEELMKVLLNFLFHENNELIASTTCTFINNLISRIDREPRAGIEQQLFEMMQTHSLPSVSQTLLRQLSLKAISPSVVGKLYDIWENHSASFLNNRDYMRMAYHLAIMLPERWRDILAIQKERLTTDDERREFEFVSRACNPDNQVQQQLFNELLEVENRRVEPWARTMLALLNDPVREPWSNRYLVPGLDELEEIQQTGDIFFPGYWLSSLLDGHCSQEARETVTKWIDAHPELAPALKNKLLENAYWLLDVRQCHNSP